LSTTWSPVAASVLVGLLILGAVYYTYTMTASQMSTLSSQNESLSAEYSALQNGTSGLQTDLQQISTLRQQISTLEQRTLSVVTMTDTVIKIQTTTSLSTASITSTSTSTVTSTLSIHPIPDNVTVYLVASGQYEDYAITLGSSFAESGSVGSNQTASQSFNVTPVYQGETISVSITLNCPAYVGPSGSASLYLNGSMVAHTSAICGGYVIGQISYVL